MAKKPVPTASRKPQPKQPVKPRSTSVGDSAARAQNREFNGNWGWVIAVLAITALCYLPSLSNGLVNWDDDPNITENPNLEHFSLRSVADIFDLKKGSVIGNYNPLPILTFGIEKWLAGGFNTTLIHTDNLLLHLLTVFFVFRLLAAMGIGASGAFVGALLFGIHPMRVESVAWATERKDVLFAAFYFAALLNYVRWIKSDDAGRRKRHYIWMLILAVLALFSKVQAVSLPLSMLALDYWFRRLDNNKELVGKALLVLPFWLLSLVFGLLNIITLRAQGSIDEDTVTFTFLDRLCIGAYSFCVYLYKLLIPYPMSPLYPYPKPLPIWVYLAPIGFFAFWAVIYWLWKKDRRIWVFGALFFFFNVVFVLQVLGAGQGFLADRFTYVAYFGFFAIAAWYYDRYVGLPSFKKGLQIATGVVFVLCAIVTVKQIGIWKNGETLWSHVMKHEKKASSLPYWNRGQYYRAQGKYDLSLKDYTQAIEINRKDPELLNSRGKTYFDMAMSGKFKDKEAAYAAQALADYNAALAMENIKPKSRSEMLINRGAAYGAQGKYTEALRDLTEGIKVDSTNKNGYFNRSIIFYQTQQYDKAIGDYTTYLRYDPYNANVWYERGMLRRGMNKNQEAIADLTRAVELNPEFGLAFRERARAYAQSGNRAAAQQDYQRAQKLKVGAEAMDQQIMNR